MARIISTNPLSFATGVARNVFLTAQFDVDLDRDSVNDLTVLLVKSSDRTVVGGVADYILGTRTVTFQLTELLESNTDYTWILVGRAEGIKTSSGATALTSNERLSFKTNTEIISGLPLADPASVVSGDIPAFQGGAGIYSVVFGRTGEPVSHVVTTAAQVGPSGTIYPAPGGSQVYLALSGTFDPDPITISGVTPLDGAHFLNADDMATISVYFSDVPVNTGLTDGGIALLAEDLLDQAVDQPTITTSISQNGIIITPSSWRAGTKYTVTVSNLIEGENTVALGTDYVFSFDLKPDLYFSTVKLVRINLDAAISKISDEVIENLIYENSQWAYEHANFGFDVDDPPIYVKDYVLCKTKLDAINIALMGTDSVTSERIGEVEFKYGNDISDRFKQKIDEILACITDSKTQILSGSKKTVMQTAVRAGTYAGRPGTDSTWRRIGTDGSFSSGRNAPGNI